MLDEQRDVLLALAQRRQVDVDDVEAVVQVLAEPAALDLVVEVAVRRGDDADVDLDRQRCEPTRSNSRSWRTRSSFACIAERHLADLVEEDRAVVGHLEAALALVIAPVNAPFSWPNSSLSSSVSGSAAQLTFDERARVALAGLVERLGDELLAGARSRR